MKTIKIRLGGSCNQNCSFCHSNKNDQYKFNHKLIPFIKYNHYNKINYGGGEPLLYWSCIKFFIDTFPNLKHHIVTNGSLFNKEMLEYTTKYDLRIGVSINDFTSISDETALLLSQVQQLGYAVIYSGDKTLDQLDALIDKMNDRLNKKVYPLYNLMHTTCNNSEAYTKEQITNYIDGIDSRVRDCVNSLFKFRTNSRYNMMTYLLIRELSNRVPGCSNYNFTTVSLDGRYMECSYDGSYTHTIEQELSYPRYNSKECYNCNLKGRCTSCVKSINKDECYIYNKIDQNLDLVLKEYNLDRETLYNTLSRKEFK